MPDLRSGAHAHPCARCRLTFASRRSLRQHVRMDHQPAPDGTRLTARLVEGQASEVELRALAPAEAAGAPTRPADLPPTAAPDDGRDASPRATPTGLLVAATLLASAALVLGMGPVPLLALSALLWSHWVRWSLLPPRATGEPGRGPRRPSSP